jgi:hypothetical protein
MVGIHRREVISPEARHEFDNECGLAKYLSINDFRQFHSISLALKCHRQIDSIAINPITRQRTRKDITPEEQRSSEENAKTANGVSYGIRQALTRWSQMDTHSEMVSTRITRYRFKRRGSGS